jgi:hypothetical protein
VNMAGDTPVLMGLCLVRQMLSKKPNTQFQVLPEPYALPPVTLRF